VAAHHAARSARAAPLHRGGGRLDPEQRLLPVRPRGGAGERAAPALRPLDGDPGRAGLRPRPAARRAGAAACGGGRPAHARGERPPGGRPLPARSARGGARHRALGAQRRSIRLHGHRSGALLPGPARGAAVPPPAARLPGPAAAPEAAGRGAARFRHARDPGPGAAGRGDDRSGREPGRADPARARPAGPGLRPRRRPARRALPDRRRLHAPPHPRRPRAGRAGERAAAPVRGRAAARAPLRQRARHAARSSARRGAPGRGAARGAEGGGEPPASAGRRAWLRGPPLGHDSAAAFGHERYRPPCDPLGARVRRTELQPGDHLP
jgi:hypothetical protein